MPFKSDAQRRWMFSQKPKMAKRWAAHTPKGKNLPEHVKNSVLSLHAGMVGKAESLPNSAKSASARVAAYKLGFLRKLAELGVMPEEFYTCVKQADLGDIAGSAFMGATDVGKSLIGTGIGWAGDAAKLLGNVAMYAPLAIGGASGVAAGAMNSPSVEDIESLRKAEILELYKRMTQEVNSRRAWRQTQA